jgi:hypothetical protein
MFRGPLAVASPYINRPPRMADPHFSPSRPRNLCVRAVPADFGAFEVPGGQLSHPLCVGADVPRTRLWDFRWCAFTRPDHAGWG